MIKDMMGAPYTEYTVHIDHLLLSFLVLESLCITGKVSELTWNASTSSWQPWGSTSYPQASFTTVGSQAKPTADTQRLAWLLQRMIAVSINSSGKKKDSSKSTKSMWKRKGNLPFAVFICSHENGC